MEISIYELHGHVSFLKARISSAKSKMREKTVRLFYFLYRSINA